MTLDFCIEFKDNSIIPSASASHHAPSDAAITVGISSTDLYSRLYGKLRGLHFPINHAQTRMEKAYNLPLPEMNARKDMHRRFVVVVVILLSGSL